MPGRCGLSPMCVRMYEVRSRMLLLWRCRDMRVGLGTGSGSRRHTKPSSRSLFFLAVVVGEPCPQRGGKDARANDCACFTNTTYPALHREAPPLPLPVNSLRSTGSYLTYYLVIFIADVS